MQGHSDGHPDENPNRELISALNTISHLKNDIAKLKSKLDRTRQIVLDDNICINEKKKIVLIDMHIEHVSSSIDRLAVKSLSRR